MSLPYGHDPQFLPCPASGDSRNQVVEPHVVDDTYLYWALSHDSSPGSHQSAFPRFQMGQFGANNGSMMFPDSGLVAIYRPDAGTSQRRSIPVNTQRVHLPNHLQCTFTHPPEERHLSSQPMPGPGPAFPSTMDSMFNRGLDDASFPQAMQAMGWPIQQDSPRTEDSHGFSYNLQSSWQYTALPSGMEGHMPGTLNTCTNLPQGPALILDCVGTTQPSPPTTGTGYVSLEDLKRYATNVGSFSVPEDHDGGYLTKTVWNPDCAAVRRGGAIYDNPVSWDLIQLSNFDGRATKAASLNDPQKVEDHGNRFYVPNRLSLSSRPSIQSIHGFPQGYGLADPNLQGSAIPTSPLVGLYHNVENPVQEVGRSVLALGFALEKQVTPRKRRKLSPEGRVKAAYLRKVGACDDCHRKKIRVNNEFVRYNDDAYTYQCIHKFPSDPKLLSTERGRKKTVKSLQMKAKAQKARASTANNLSVVVPDLTPDSSPDELTSPVTPGSANKPERELGGPRSVADVGTPRNALEVPTNGYITQESSIDSMDNDGVPEKPISDDFEDFPLFDGSQFDGFLKYLSQHSKNL